MPETRGGGYVEDPLGRALSDCCRKEQEQHEPHKNKIAPRRVKRRCYSVPAVTAYQVSRNAIWICRSWLYTLVMVPKAVEVWVRFGPFITG